ncbi:MAG: hypothetical protein US86_C0002G0015 [Candidatus Daviesbacteria bacterium GW2011_GWA2_38_24]|uniref:Uncharacterized protein n=1 Tax=Candidatus Daviesbacteria bacterium GW2011_GWA2_38_24 TaxID=1618422 RepID=A0A0G0JGS4_9BACT|nr:MAG: hypothetical protein US86_C0002G0015 [Candidatus Daviesbacteria bacterium GW2011_GWA2_38_24]
MDAHSVPQNVTSFQFKLIGDMTLKQFTYLGSGVGVAYIAFVLMAQPFPIIAWPIIILSSAIGAAFAFLPINERPLDHWVGAYFQAVFSPTKRAWKHKKVKTENVTFKNRLPIYMETLKSEIPLPAKTPQPPVIPPQTPPNPLNTQNPQSQTTHQSEDLKELVDTAREAQIIQSRIIETEHELNAIKAEASTPGVDTAVFAQRFQLVLDKLQKLTTQANEVSAQINALEPVPQPMAKPKVQVVTMPKKQVASSFSLTSTPNVISGIVTDAQNNYIEGVIVVTHDKEGLPVRALKTNKLGQFITATPLPNGTYTLTLEKENLVFDDIRIDLDGTLLSPVRIAAKPNLGGTP